MELAVALINMRCIWISQRPEISKEPIFLHTNKKWECLLDLLWHIHLFYPNTQQPIVQNQNTDKIDCFIVRTELLLDSTFSELFFSMYYSTFRMNEIVMIIGDGKLGYISIYLFN